MAKVKKIKKKTHKSTSKRFKITASGKLHHKKQGDNNHYMTKRSGGRALRNEENGTISSKKEAKKLKSLGNL